jgi:hypothetical protein
MPLIILGLITIVGIVILALVQYGRSGEEDTRPVRERYSHAFPPKRRDPDDPDDNGPEGSHTIYFPEDAEVQKRKRNIH